MCYKRMAVYHLWVLSVILLLVPGRAQISALSETHEAEAKSCETPTGAAGVCRLLTECPSVVRAIAYGNRQHTRCGFVDAVEVVCCPLESATHSVSSSSTRIESPTASPYSSETSFTSDVNLLAPHKEHEARPTEEEITDPQSVNTTEEEIITSDETNVLENSDENETRNLSSENNTSEDGLSERIFLSRKKKLLAPILPSTLLKNIVSSILAKPTRATQKTTLELKPTSNPVKENEPDKINNDEVPSTNPRPNTPNSSNYEPFTRPVLTIQPGIPQPTPDIPPVPWLPPTKPTDLEAESSEIIVPILKPIYDPYNATLTIPHSDPIPVSTQLHYPASNPSAIYNEKPTVPFFYNFPSTTSAPEEPTTNHESYWEDFPDEPVTEVPNSLPTESSIGYPWPTAVQRPTTERGEATKPNPDSSEILYPLSRPDIVSQNQPLEPSLTPSVQNQSAAQKPSDIWKKITSLAAGLKSRRACDAYRKIPVLTRYIIGGDYAAHGEFPHMVALGFRKPKDTNLSWLCGGSLISNQYVLTAAHCIKTRYGAPQVVRVGFTDLSAAPGAVGSEATGEEEEVAVAAALAHPAYDAAARAHDIALLRLARPLRFSQAVLPACLRAAAPAPPGPLLVTGWGSVTPDGSTPSDLMKKALVTPTDDATCRSFYRNFYRPEMICAGSNDEVDTCKGDSGGPMQLLEDPTSPIYTVVGITSFGPTPCAGPRPGVYTRVASYLSWLEAVVWPDDAT